MEKKELIIGLIDDLLSLSEEKYQEAKAYWEKNPPKSKELISFLRILFLCTDEKRAGGATNADA